LTNLAARADLPTPPAVRTIVSKDLSSVKASNTNHPVLLSCTCASLYDSTAKLLKREKEREL
jgi:hypothetical protein